MSYEDKLSINYCPTDCYFKDKFLTKKEAKNIARGINEKQNIKAFQKTVDYVLQTIVEKAEEGIFELDICVRGNFFYTKKEDVFTSFSLIPEQENPYLYSDLSSLSQFNMFYEENTQDLIQFLESLGYNAYLTVDSSDMRIIHIDWK